MSSGRLILIILTGFLLPSIVRARQEVTVACTDDHTTMMEQAAVARGREDYQRSIAFYTCALQLEPDDDRAFNGRGLAYQKMGDHLRAIEDFTQALELDPMMVDTYDNRGWSHYKQTDYEVALSDFTRAIQLDRDFARAYTDRGLAFWKIGAYEAAAADFEQSIALDYELSHLPYANLAGVYYDLGDYAQAIDYLQQSVDFKPDYADGYRWLGDVYFQTQDYPAALEHYRQYVDLAGDKTPVSVRDRMRQIEGQGTLVLSLPMLTIGAIVVYTVTMMIWPRLRWRKDGEPELEPVPMAMRKTATRIDVALADEVPKPEAVPGRLAIAPVSAESRGSVIVMNTGRLNGRGSWLLLGLLAVVMVGVVAYVLGRAATKDDRGEAEDDENPAEKEGLINRE